jgi:hypothetical protein
MLRFPILILLLIFSLLFACSTPSWFPIKMGSPHKAKMKELVNKEVIIIDKEEYVKVSNPRASGGGNQPKYLYIPVDEYLSNKETFTTPVTAKGEMKKDLSTPSTQPLSSSTERNTFSVSPSTLTPMDLKKKVVIAYLDDRTTGADEVFGDWVAEKLTREVNQRSQRVLFIDYQMVQDFLEKKGFVLADLETPKVLSLLNEGLGIHALVVGQLSGPYVFATKTAKDQDAAASAILKLEMRIVDTFSGRILKDLSASNPIIASREKGVFPEERAKVRAIDLTINDISKALSRELDNLDWFCRVAKVEGEEIYINAGKLTGLKIGDVMAVFRPGGAGERGELKGKIQISAFLGIDASMAKLVDGKKPDVNDILKPAKGT